MLSHLCDAIIVRGLDTLLGLVGGKEGVQNVGGSFNTKL